MEELKGSATLSHLAREVLTKEFFAPTDYEKDVLGVLNGKDGMFRLPSAMWHTTYAPPNTAE